MAEMKHRDVRRHFLDRREDRLDRETRTRIDRHLETCGECRTYFESLSSLLETPDAARLPRLEPDPFLPTRVRAIVDGEKKVARGPVSGMRRRFLGWTMVTSISVIVALAVGIFIGRDIASAPVCETDTAIAEAFYDAMAPSSLFSDPGEVLENDEKDI